MLYTNFLYDKPSLKCIQNFGWKRSFGRHGCRWDNNITMYLGERG